MLEHHDPDRFLAEVERRLDVQFAPDPSAPTGPDKGVLAEAARHICLADGAKRSRPRLVQLFGRAVDAPHEAVVDVAVAGELIHAASLLHDDVVDEGTQRRGRPTANRVWGNLAAVLAGDLILARAIQMLLPRPPQVTDGALSVVVEMSQSAILEAEHRYTPTLPVAVWRAIAEGKTGALLGWCGRACAQIAGDDEGARRFGACGRHLGIAYQLADDIWDFEGLKGKDPLQDLRHGNPSFVLASAAAADASIPAALHSFWSQGSPEGACADLAARIADVGALDNARDTVRSEIDQALEALGPYALRPGGQDIERWSKLLAMSFTRTLEPERLEREASP